MLTHRRVRCLPRSGVRRQAARSVPRRFVAAVANGRAVLGLRRLRSRGRHRQLLRHEFQSGRTHGPFRGEPIGAAPFVQVGPGRSASVFTSPAPRNCAPRSPKPVVVMEEAQLSVPVP